MQKDADLGECLTVLDAVKRKSKIFFTCPVGVIFFGKMRFTCGEQSTKILPCRAGALGSED